MKVELDESTKRALAAAAKLLESDSPEKEIEFVYVLGYLDGLLKMERAVTARVVKQMRQA